MARRRGNPAVRWFVEPVLRRTLPRSVERELQLAKEILEGRPTAKAEWDR